MDETNKQIIQDVANQLNNSITTNWSSGDLEQWSNYAKRMKNTIIAVVPILKTLANAKTDADAKPQTSTGKKEQQVVITDYPNDVNSLIDKGWIVVSVTAQHVSTGSSATSKGNFCFLLEK